MREPPVVGFVGLGRMGLPMAGNLLAKGFPVVGFNRTAARAEPLRAAGATIAPSVGDLVAQADIVCACLDRVETSVEVFLGADGVLGRGKPGMLAIDFSTIGPDTAREIASGLATRGIEFLDAPVSGGPEGATKATLTIMTGGREAAFRAAEGVLRACGTTVVRMGEVGAGSLTKLVNQMLTFVHGAVAAEALAFAERNGLDLAAVGEVMKVSFGQSRMLERTLGRVLAGDFEAGAALRLYAKDLGIIDQVGRQVGASLPLTEAAETLLERARKAGFGDRDLAALMEVFRRQALDMGG
ncbi:MAG: NAD(P)-dependent oxidoreductase [Gemmatimonadetes bacterium]|nr:NAD(P)-dependent oxidoreductase [Gemmatimonadota bacterium]